MRLRVGVCTDLLQQAQLPAVCVLLEPVHVLPQLFDFLLHLLHRIELVLDLYHITFHLRGKGKREKM